MKLSNKAAKRLAALINGIEVWGRIASTTNEKLLHGNVPEKLRDEEYKTLGLANDNYDREIIALFNEFGVKLPNTDKALARAADPCRIAA